MFVAFIRVALEMQQQASVSRFSVHLCFNLCSVLDYFHTDKGDLVINRVVIKVSRSFRWSRVRLEQPLRFFRVLQTFRVNHFSVIYAKDELVVNW